MMTRAKWFHERAAHSLKLATSATDEEQRALLVQMAESWTRLADGAGVLIALPAKANNLRRTVFQVAGAF